MVRRLLRGLQQATQGVLRPEAPRGGAPEARKGYICTNICVKTKQQSAFKHFPNLEKACIMPWDVLEKNKLITLTLPKSGAGRNIGVGLVVRCAHHASEAVLRPRTTSRRRGAAPRRAAGGRFFLPYVRQYTQNVLLTLSVYPLVYVVPTTLECYAFCQEARTR